MLDNETLNKIAYAMVEEQTKNYLSGNKMGYFLMLNGIMRFKLESHPGAGHNYRIILDQIYEFYKNHSEIPMGEILKEALLKNISLLVDFEKLNLNMNYILEQLENEKTGKAPFKIDNIVLLNEIKNKVLNAEEIKKDPRLKSWVENNDNYIQENYGYKIL